MTQLEPNHQRQSSLMPNLLGWHSKLDAREMLTFVVPFTPSFYQKSNPSRADDGSVLLRETSLRQHCYNYSVRSTRRLKLERQSMLLDPYISMSAGSEGSDTSMILGNIRRRGPSTVESTGVFPPNIKRSV